MSALQTMAMNMFKDVLQNLPPDVKEKLDQIGAFTAMLDARLANLDCKLDMIIARLGVNDERTLDDGRHDNRSRDDDYERQRGGN